MRNMIILVSIFTISILSCRKGDTATTNNDKAIRFPVTEEEKNSVALNKEVAQLLEEVYKVPAAWQEVNATISTGYYEDERVLLKDLLFPATSALFQSQAFKGTGVQSGQFKKLFEVALSKGNYPLLSQQLVSANSRNRVTGATPGDPVLLTPGKIFSTTKGISIYFPYASNFNNALTTGTPRRHSPPAIVAADREADTGPGREPLACGNSWCYQPVIVNDAYCELNPTHIVEEGATPSTLVQYDPGSQLPLVFLGNIKCAHQYDKLISFTGNGGGSELRFIRGDAFLSQNSNGQITSPENTISVSVSRSDIRKKRWKTINSIWDSNWETDNKEQVFGIYEEDNEGSKTFSGSIQTKIFDFTIKPIDYSITVKTKDEIIRQLNWSRESFFTYNRGGLSNGCGNTNGWTIYDCQTAVAYTLPQQ